ncbi:hypothetical protein [Faecalimicrobium sp. JNUCC 81]
MIKNNAIEIIADAFIGIKAHSKFKLIKADLDKSRYVEATYRYKNKEENKDIELTFSVPRFYISNEDPIVDIGTLSTICRNLSLHDNYYMNCLNISNEKIKAEFFNRFDNTTIKVKTSRDSLLDA